jgi:hypothetical protein
LISSASSLKHEVSKNKMATNKDVVVLNIIMVFILILNAYNM